MRLLIASFPAELQVCGDVATAEIRHCETPDGFIEALHLTWKGWLLHVSKQQSPRD